MTFSKIMFYQVMNHIVSKYDITSYEQIRNIFIKERNQLLRFLIEKKNEIQELLRYLKKKRIESAKENQSKKEIISKSSFFYNFLLFF